jgi:SAM-dependent methyltransferase
VRNKWSHAYERQVSASEIAVGEHRTFVGGLWDEIGELQFRYLKNAGLLPQHRLLDVGCGALRGGLHFIRYLNPGNYYGIDMNESLIRAGREVELPRAGLAGRNPHLLVISAFEFQQFHSTFQFALALSVFTHIPINAIQRCLVSISRVLEPGGRFFATYFPAAKLHALDLIVHSFGDSRVTTNSDDDPFHYHLSVFEFLTNDLLLRVESLGDWDHPRGQHILEFVRTEVTISRDDICRSAA